MIVTISVAVGLVFVAWLWISSVIDMFRSDKESDS